MFRLPDTIDSVICPYCLKSFRAKAGLSAIGFRTYACPSCAKTVYYPLASDHYSLFSAMAVITALPLVLLLPLAVHSLDSTPLLTLCSWCVYLLPAPLAVVSVVGLINDARIRARVAVTEDRARRGSQNGPA